MNRYLPKYAGYSYGLRRQLGSEKDDGRKESIPDSASLWFVAMLGARLVGVSTTGLVLCGFEEALFTEEISSASSGSMLFSNKGVDALIVASVASANGVTRLV